MLQGRIVRSSSIILPYWNSPPVHSVFERLVIPEAAMIDLSGACSFSTNKVPISGLAPELSRLH